MLEKVRQRASQFDFLRFMEPKAQTSRTLSVVKRWTRRVGDVGRTRWCLDRREGVGAQYPGRPLIAINSGRRFERVEAPAEGQNWFLMRRMQKQCRVRN
jgi:hypothetical protein